MKILKYVLLFSFGLMALIFLLIIEAYFVKFSGGISGKTDNWLLFITICNWGFISSLTGLNIWVFYKLTTLIDQNDNNRFIENKVSISEKAILELRVNDYKALREQAINLKLAILKTKDYNSEFNAFMKILLSMQDSRLFSRIDNKGSVLDEVVKFIADASKADNFNAETLILKIDSVLRSIEFLIFSQQLRDDRILREVREHPNRFDVTIVGIDNKMQDYDKSR